MKIFVVVCYSSRSLKKNLNHEVAVATRKSCCHFKLPVSPKMVLFRKISVNFFIFKFLHLQDGDFINFLYDWLKLFTVSSSVYLYFLLKISINQLVKTGGCIDISKNFEPLDYIQLMFNCLTNLKLQWRNKTMKLNSSFNWFMFVLYKISDDTNQ